MAIFDECIDFVLGHEGGFVVDHSGATNWGVTLRTLQEAHRLGIVDADEDRDGDVDSDDVRAMPVWKAKEIYKVQWWRRYRYRDIGSDGVAMKLLDLAVNMGQRQAARLIQSALWACGHKVAIDGDVGPVTRGAINRTRGDVLVAALRSEAAGFYRFLVMRNPMKFKKYEAGWLKRAYA